MVVPALPPPPPDDAPPPDEVPGDELLVEALALVPPEVGELELAEPPEEVGVSLGVDDVEAEVVVVAVVPVIAVEADTLDVGTVSGVMLEVFAADVLPPPPPHADSAMHTNPAAIAPAQFRRRRKRSALRRGRVKTRAGPSACRSGGSRSGPSG